MRGLIDLEIDAPKRQTESYIASTAWNLQRPNGPWLLSVTLFAAHKQTRRRMHIHNNERARVQLADDDAGVDCLLSRLPPTNKHNIGATQKTAAARGRQDMHNEPARNAALRHVLYAGVLIPLSYVLLHLGDHAGEDLERALEVLEVRRLVVGVVPVRWRVWV
jgi:hypothetical protein